MRHRTPDVYLHIVLPEASRYHPPSRDFAASYSPGVRIRLEMGRYMLAEDYMRAMRLAGGLAAAVDRALEGCHALLLPAATDPAPCSAQASVDIEGAA